MGAHLQAPALRHGATILLVRACRNIALHGGQSIACSELVYDVVSGRVGRGCFGVLIRCCDACRQIKSARAEAALPEFDLGRRVGRKIGLQRARRAVVLCVVDAADFDGSLPRAALQGLFSAIEGYQARAFAPALWTCLPPPEGAQLLTRPAGRLESDAFE